MIKNSMTWQVVKTPSLVFLGLLEHETSNLNEAKEVAIEKLRIERGKIGGRTKRLREEIAENTRRRNQLSESIKEIQALRSEDIK